MISNAWLDSVACARIGSGHRPQPAFRSLGLAGYALACCVMIGGSVLTGQPAAGAVAISASCAAAFYGYALLRRRIYGRETHVLFEQLWLSIAVCAAVAAALRVNVWASLDLFAAAMACFLTVG